MIYSLNEAYFVRPLEEGDVHGSYPRWFQDQEVCRYNSHGKFFQPEDYFRDYVAACAQERRIVWAVCHREDGHVGNVSLQDIATIDHTAEFAILLGDRRHWGKGLGFLAGRALFTHGFDKLDLARIHCSTAATNLGMRKLALRLGMTLEGTRRQHLFLEGSRVDVVEYGVLREEFRERVV